MLKNWDQNWIVSVRSWVEYQSCFQMVTPITWPEKLDRLMFGHKKVQLSDGSQPSGIWMDPLECNCQSKLQVVKDHWITICKVALNYKMSNGLNCNLSNDNKLSVKITSSKIALNLQSKLQVLKLHWIVPHHLHLLRRRRCNHSGPHRKQQKQQTLSLRNKWKI